MSMPGEIELLRPAVERLRAVLRRLDPGDVPAKLRPLTRSSARRVPPPLLRGAVDALSEDEWLRTQVVEKGMKLDPDATETPEAASALFLQRPPSWEERFKSLVEESEETKLAGRVARLEQRRRDDAKTIRGLRAEIKGLQDERDAIESRTAERQRSDLHEERGKAARAERRRVEAERKNQELSDRLASVEEELRATLSRLADTRQALERERRKPSPRPVADDISGMPGSPEDVAAVLDRVMLTVRREHGGEELLDVGDEMVRPAELPDRAEAVSELIDRPRDWLIDGYNVSYLLAGRRPESMDRLRLESSLRQLLTRAVRGSTVTVYWDSAEGEDSRNGRGIGVRFAASADDAIIDRAGPGTVVVSTDRRVREASEARGAVTLWSEALVEWLRT